MATLLTFHAHPDDEAIATGGLMAKAAAAGHRVVLVVATRGELGEVPDGFLVEGESLADRRVGETHAAARILGVDRVEFLDYRDSGMMGEPANDGPGSFWTADVSEAAGRLAALLDEESVDVLTVYDQNGGYGHPDHIQVHRVGHAAAGLVGTPRVYEATMNRDRLIALTDALRRSDIQLPGGDEIDLSGIGSPDSIITTRVDVSEWVDVKRRAMAAHASQIDEGSFFLALPPSLFAEAFGTESFIRAGAPSDAREIDLFDGL